MNPIFWLIVIIVLALVWLCLSFAYKKVGWIGWKLYKDAKDIITNTENEKEENEK